MNRYLSRSLRAAAFLSFVLSLVPPAHAEGFFVLSADAKLDGGVHRLSARVRYELSADVRSAITNGIPVGLRLDIEILRPRAFMWSETVAELQQLYRLRYHALSRRYITTNVNSGAQNDFATLDEALASLSAVSGLPLIDNSLLEPDDALTVRVSAGLDYDVLPVPMRYYARTFPSWRLTSEWYNFPLR